MTRLALLLTLLTSAARADDGVTLRLGTVAPEGTAWARELKAFARDVAAQTSGAINVKWYMGGIAGDDVQVAERMRRDQLDGAGSGGMLCARASATWRAIQLLARWPDEAFYVTNRLRPQIEEEFRKNGFYFLGGAGLGPDVIFSRAPVHSFDDLKKAGPFWVWDIDDVSMAIYPRLGIKLQPLPIHQASHAYDDKSLAGFIALPAAALAFQWSAQTRYIIDLRMGYVSGCVVLSNRAYDLIPTEHRDLFRAATAKMQARFQDLGVQQDNVLLGGAFARQGLSPIAASEAFQREFEKAAQAARDQVTDKLAPKATLDRVQQALDEFHSQKHARQ
jgi:TRAP-type C4-dicarboxylate transport system substrate-binding protein